MEELNEAVKELEAQKNMLQLTKEDIEKATHAKRNQRYRERGHIIRGKVKRDQRLETKNTAAKTRKG